MSAGHDPDDPDELTSPELAATVDAPASTVAASDAEVDRADRLAQRLALPVLIAALASVPAVFLSLMDEPWGSVGDGLNTLSGAVLIAETVVLLAVADDRRAWLRRNRWLVLLAVVIVPAVILALGPVQLLRLLRVGMQIVRSVGALRVIRVGRIMKAGRIVRERTGLDAGWQRAIGIAVTVAAAAFVAIVLVDPTSASRQVLDGALDRLGLLGVVLAGLLLGVATYIVRTTRGRDEDDEGEAGSEAGSSDEDTARPQR